MLVMGQEDSDFAYIVAIRILNEGESIIGNLVHKLHALMVRGMVYASLQDAAAMPMCRNFNAIGSNSVVNELHPKHKICCNS